MNRLKNFVKDLLCFVCFSLWISIKGTSYTCKYTKIQYRHVYNYIEFSNLINKCVNKITFLLSFTRSILLTKMQKFWNKKRLHVPSKWLYSLIMIISEDCVYWLSCWLVFHSSYCSDFKLSNSSTKKKPTTKKLLPNENRKKNSSFSS